MTVDETNTMKGFSGLNDLVSNISSETEADIGASSSVNQPEPQQTSEPLPNIETNYSTPSVSYAPLVGKVLLGAFILFVIWGISLSNSSNSTSESSYTASSSDYNTTVETPEPVDSYAESIPPAMTGATLTKDQVQYCVSQKIRMSEIQSKLNRTSDLEINNFNQLVDDFNTRCSNYYYREGVLEQAQADAAAHTARLEREAQGLLEQWRQEEAANMEADSSTQAAIAPPVAPTTPVPVPVAHIPRPITDYKVPDFDAPVPREAESFEPVQSDINENQQTDSGEIE